MKSHVKCTKVSVSAVILLVIKETSHEEVSGGRLLNYVLLQELLFKVFFSVLLLLCLLLCKEKESRKSGPEEQNS